MKRLLLFLLIVLSGMQLSAQTYNMQNGTFTTCSGKFYDSGGPTANYMANENYEITFNPATPGTYVQLDFVNFVMQGEPSDYMTIYDGVGTAGDIIGTYGDESPVTCNGGLVTSSDLSGSLTIVFTSDNRTQYRGWEANILCSPTPGDNFGGTGNSICAGAKPFCADTPLEFANSSLADCVNNAPGDVTRNTCLREAPNPVWYFLKVGSTGDIRLRIRQSTLPNGAGAQLDVDFAIWGPFNNSSSTCSDFTLGGCTDDHDCTGNVVDCSYSDDAVETANILNAQAGDIYMVLITNYDGRDGYISMTQTNTGGGGATDCTITCPTVAGSNPACGSSTGTITVSGLIPGTTYTITYLDDTVPASYTAVSNSAGKIVISNLDAGSYTNILVNFPGCTLPLAVTLTNAGNPTLTSVTPSLAICSGSNATFALLGSPNATVTFKINNGANQTVLLSTIGKATVTVNSVTANTVFTAVSIAISTCSTTVTTTATVTVKPKPGVNLPTVSPICSGSSINLQVTGTITGTTFAWAVLSQTNASGATAGTGATLAQALTATAAVAGTVVYRITPTANGCAGATKDLTVTVNPKPVMNTPAAAQICSGNATAIPLTAPTAVTFDWTVVQTGTSGAIAGSGSTIAQTITATGNVAGTATYTITPKANGCYGTPVSVTVTVVPKATLINVSESICTGNATNVTLASNATGATFSWTVLSQTNVTGATAGTGALIAQTLTNTGSISGTAVYRVTPSANGCPGTPRNVVVTVNPRPSMNIPAAGPVCSGNAAVINLSSPVAGTTYSWTVSQTGTSGATAGSGTRISNTLRVTGTVAGTATYTITPKIGGCLGIPTTVVVDVNPRPVANAVSQTICSGDTADVWLTSTVGSTTFSWTVLSQTNVTGASAGSGGRIIQTLSTSSSIARGTVVYRILPEANGCTGATKDVTVIVNPNPTMNIPAPVSVCSGNTTAIPLNSAATGTTFSWTVVQTGTAGAIAGTGTTISQLLRVTGTAPGTAVYTITPKFGSCTGTPVNVTVTVNPKAVVNANPQSICSGDTTNIPLSSAVAGTSFSWSILSETNARGAVAGSGTAIAQPLTATGTIPGVVVYRITPSANGCPGIAKDVAVTVNPTATVSFPAFAQPVCSGTLINVGLTGTIPGTTYDWTITQTGVSGASAGSGSTIRQALIATGNTAGSVRYTITPKAHGCYGTPVSLTVNVNPKPAITAVPLQAVCSGETTSIALTSAVAGTTYSWTVVQTNASGATQGTGNRIDQSLTATGNIAGKVVYTVTPTANGCTGTPLVIEVKVNPLPVPKPEDGIICVVESSGFVQRSYTIDTHLSNANYDFTWYWNEQLQTEQSSQMVATRSGTYKVIAKNKLTNCTSLPVEVTVTESFVAEAIAIKGDDAFTDHPTITVNLVGSGVYEYQLDYGPFQSSNIFMDVSNGSHTIHVRDANDCTDLSKAFSIIGYPKLFTPNNDGYNDTWNIVGLSDQPAAQIFIFDRYGKIIRQISTGGEGWDGTYNGTVLPADDYWFTINYLDKQVPKEFKAHFSLKR